MPAPVSMRSSLRLLSMLPLLSLSAAPSLSVSPQPGDKVQLEWDATGNPILESTGSLSSSWLPITETPAINGGIANLSLAITEQTRFFRLRIVTSTKIVGSSPYSGESGVAVTREVVLRFSHPLAENTRITTDQYYAQVDGRRLLSRIELGADRLSASLFFLETVPASAQIQVVLAGTEIRDSNNAFIDPDGDGSPGGTLRLTYSTASIAPTPATAVSGHVYASERNPDGSNRPLSGVTISVDGAEELIRTTTDAQGFFQLNECPTGRFFVHIDGRTAAGSAWPAGAYYPFVGKAWETTPGRTNALPGGSGEIFLPLISPGTLKEVSAVDPTPISFTPDVLAQNPTLSGVQIVVPKNSLFSDSGARGGKVGMAPVPPDRLPEPLPPGLEMPLVITIQTDGPQNFSEPVPARFPNLPDPLTGLKLPPGAKSGLWSFNHDTGRWEPQGSMTVTADGNYIETDPGVGIRQPGWHGANPGNNGDGPEEDDNRDEQDEPECKDKNKNFLCDENEPRDCKDKNLNAKFNGMDCLSDITLGLATKEMSWLESCTMGIAIGSWRVVRDCAVFDNSTCESSAAAKIIDADIGCIPGIGGWIGSFKCAIETITAYEDYWKCLNGKAAASARHAAPADAVVVPFPQVPEYLQRALTDLNNQIRLIERAQDHLEAVLGTNKWNYLSPSENPEPLITLTQALRSAISPSGDSGESISTEEESYLLTLPRPSFATQEDVRTLVQRIRQLQTSPKDPELRARWLITSTAALAAAEPLVDDGWVTLLDGGIRALITLSEALEPHVGSDEFPAAPHFYLLRDLETGFTRRGQLNSSGNFDPIVLPPNRLHGVVYYDPISNRRGAALFRSGAPGGSTRIPAAVLVPDSSGDTDGDGLSNRAETILGTATDRADSDGDGKNDRLELVDGSSPVDGISLPLGPIGSAEIAQGSAETVAAEGEFLYTGGVGNTLTVFSLANPRQPTRLGSLQIRALDYSYGLAVRKGIVALGGRAGLAVVDARNPAALTMLFQIADGTVNAVDWLGDDILALMGNQLLRVDGFTGAVKLTTPLETAGEDIRVVGEWVYVITTTQLRTFKQVDGLIVEFGRITVAGTPAPLEVGRKLFVGGGLAYVGTRTGFFAFDVANPATPILLSSPTGTQVAFHDLVANDAGLLTTISFSGVASLVVSAYDVSDPTDSTRFLTSWPTFGICRTLLFHRGVEYVGDSARGIHILNPLAPDVAGIAPTLSFTANFPTNPARAQFGAPIQLLVDARDDIHTREVTAFVDGTSVAEDASFPFQLDFTAPTASSGLTQFTLRLRAIDTAGNTRWTDPMVVPLAEIPIPPRLLSLEPKPSSKADNQGLITVTAGFDAPIAPDSIRTDTLTVLGAGADRVFGTQDDVPQTGSTKLDASGRTLEFSRTTNFPAGLYRVTVADGIRGTNGVERTEKLLWVFESFAARPSLSRTLPTGVSGTPSNGLTNLQAFLSLAISADRTLHPTFLLREAGVDRTRGNSDDVTVPLASATLKPTRDGYDIVPVTPIPAGRYRLSMSGNGYTASLVDFTLRPVPNTWISAGGGRWNNANSWSGGTPVVDDYLRIPKLPTGVATTNSTLVSIARLESQADFVQEGGQLEISGEGIFYGLSRFLGSDAVNIAVTGGGTLVNRGTMQLRGGATTANRGVSLQTITLANRSLLEWQAGQLFFTEPTSLLFNEPSAIFDIGPAATRTGTQSTPEGRILNAGLVRKRSGTNTADLRSITFENSGKVQIDSGRIDFGDYQGSGDLEIAAGASAGFRRFLRLPQEARLSGAGDCFIVGGSSNVPKVLTHRHELTGLTIAESNFTEVRRALDFPGIQFQSLSGWFRFMAPLKAHRLWISKGSQGGIELHGPTTTDILQLEQGSLQGPGLLSVNQNLLWTNGDIDPGGEITVLGNADLRGIGTLNQRQFRLAPGATMLAVSNCSIVTKTRGLEGTFINQGTFIKNTPGRVSIGVLFENRGVMRLEQGQTLFARTPQSDGRITQAGGEIQFAGGDLELYLQGDAIGTSLSSTSGGISGFGRILNTSVGGSAPIDNSSLFRLNAPGKALQLVDIGYRQTTRGTLEITLGEAGPAQLLGDPNRTLSLAGQLRVVLQPGFTPLLGQSFVLCQGRIGGTFAQVTLPDLGPALKFELVYSQTQVVLNVVAKP